MTENGGILCRGFQVPAIMYGTAWKEERTSALTEQAIRTGYRAIDTANQRRHYCEAEVGAAVAHAVSEGLCPRAELFLQTKFTYLGGQDHRLPYDPAAALATQVRQSMESSLGHLDTDYVDSYVLHGPATGMGWSRDDEEVWRTMAELLRDGKAKLLGVSNVSLGHLEALATSSEELPAIVQNRCFARRGWDRAVRAWCREHGAVYQGFSLLTANPEVVGHPQVLRMAAEHSVTTAQLVLRFAQQVGMLPLTGTTDATHMRQDLECARFSLTPQQLDWLETLAG
ncbi:MAG: aldo/keto reductase [Candidatus Wallbacteria bacterium]|nr:aldo/keto reductase [Candidatus Wallbacteria bacterium]